MNTKLVIIAIVLTLTSCRSIKKVTSSSESYDTHNSQIGTTIIDSIKSTVVHNYTTESKSDSSFTTEVTDYILIRDTVSGNIISLPKTTSKVTKAYSSKLTELSSEDSSYSKNSIVIDTTKVNSTQYNLEKVNTKIKRDSTAIVRVGYLLFALVIIAYGVIRKYFPSIFVKVRKFIKL